MNLVDAIGFNLIVDVNSASFLELVIGRSPITNISFFFSFSIYQMHLPNFIEDNSILVS